MSHTSRGLATPQSPPVAAAEAESGVDADADACGIRLRTDLPDSSPPIGRLPGALSYLDLGGDGRAARQL